LKTLAYYPPLFAKAFGDGNITSDRIFACLSAIPFVRLFLINQSTMQVDRQLQAQGRRPTQYTIPEFYAR